jgi:hypothetical protein
LTTEIVETTLISTFNLLNIVHILATSHLNVGLVDPIYRLKEGSGGGGVGYRLQARRTKSTAVKFPAT